MNRKHIGVIYAGGTIGMKKTAQGYAPMDDFPAVLSALIVPADDALPRYTLHAYATPIDSANATPADWSRIGQDIASRYQDYDGFVVLHGTDTMAYTAAALSFMLRGLHKPVIVTGSQIPLGEVGSDALPNLMGAMQVAALEGIHEVAIYFGQRLLRGNRATKVSAECLQAFDSPHYPWLGEDETDIHVNRAALLVCSDKEEFVFPAYTPGRIWSIRFVPGLPIQVVQAMLDVKPQAVILECYGAGNAPNNEPGLHALLAQAHQEGTVLVARSQSLHGEVDLEAYATGSSLAQAGVIGAKDMTFEAAFVKLHHLFAQGLPPAAVRTVFLRDLCGEITSRS